MGTSGNHRPASPSWPQNTSEIDRDDPRLASASRVRHLGKRVRPVTAQIFGDEFSHGWRGSFGIAP
jgi:hypothetical protein